MKFSSLAALEIVKMATFGASSDENFVKMTTFLSHCLYQLLALGLQEEVSLVLYTTLSLSTDSNFIHIYTDQ